MDTIQTNSQERALCTAASQTRGCASCSSEETNHMRTAAKKKRAAVLTVPSVKETTVKLENTEAKFECIVIILSLLHCYNVI